MNPYTGEVVELVRGQTVPDGFERLSDFLSRQARRVKDAGGRVELDAGTPLALWAAAKRRQRARKRRTANASRRRNRQ